MNLVIEFLSHFENLIEDIPAHIEYTEYTVFVLLAIIFLIVLRRMIYKKFVSKINNNQKHVVSIIISLIFFVITISITDEIGSYSNYYSSGGGPFNWDKTYFIWIEFLLLIGYINFLIFKD